MTKQSQVGDREVQMDRRRLNERRIAEPRTLGPASDHANSTLDRPTTRRKQQRRRQIDPTTCERDYSDPEIQFMQAIDAYKRSSGRMFPTCSEILEVIKSLGYEQLSEAEAAMLRSVRELEAANRETLAAEVSCESDAGQLA